jgi:hypothetical protein
METVETSISIRTPAESIIKEAAEKLFTAGTGLHVDPDSWRYKALPEKGIAEARFSLSDGTKIVFANVLILAQYGKISPHKLEVRASVDGFSPVQREFFVAHR